MAQVLSDPALHAFTGGAPLSEEELRARYVRLTRGSPDPAVQWHNWVLQLRAAACLVGTVQATVTTAPDGTREAEIAWVVGSPWQGRSFASEAARALVAELDAQGIAAVCAHIHPGHHASAAVATAAGLRQVDEWRDGEVRWEARLSRPVGPSTGDAGEETPAGP